jgi:hypothetical protein
MKYTKHLTTWMNIKSMILKPGIAVYLYNSSYSGGERLGGSQFEASPGRKVARPHLNKLSMVMSHVVPATWEAIGKKVIAWSEAITGPKLEILPEK